MKILIVAPYVTFPDEPGANRFVALARMLSDRHQVTLLTSKFCHILKTHRKQKQKLKNIEVILLDEPGYKKNVSLARLKSHRKFCQNFQSFMLAHQSSYDVIYSAYPLIKTNYFLGQLKQKSDFKLIIDVQDIWPESIFGPIPWLSNRLGEFILLPITKYANHTYAYADALVAVSETYMHRADVNHLPNSHKEVVYIGADNLYFNTKTNKSNTKVIATYIGTMGGSYDLATVIKASALCHPQVEIQFIGTGPDEASLKKLNEKIGGHVKFLGTMPYLQAMQVLSRSDIAINPIRSTAQQSITNKLSDYFCCGLPIISCQKSSEVEKLLAQGGSVSYLSGNADDLSERLIQLAKDQVKLNAMKNANKHIAIQSFLREKSYLKIIKLIERIVI